VQELIRYETARRALAEAHAADEVKAIRDKAVALETYARQANDPEMEIMAAVIRLWSERRAGELLEEMKKNGERDAGKGGDRKSLSRDKIVKLPDLGITFNQSSRWKNISHESVNMSQTNART
jgi:hypothetical protein